MDVDLEDLLAGDHSPFTAVEQNFPEMRHGTELQPPQEENTQKLKKCILNSREANDMNLLVYVVPQVSES